MKLATHRHPQEHKSSEGVGYARRKLGKEIKTMKTNTSLLSTLKHGCGCTLAVATTAILLGTAQAQETTKPMKPMKGGEHQMMLNQSKPPTPEETKEMMERCQAMMKHKQAMQADMKAQDADLTAQVAKMNSAPDSKKAGLMAGIVTTMVEQRTAMTAHKAKMDEEMMAHMMKHMQMGAESMAQCPMMKGSSDKPKTAHKEHQSDQK